METLKRDDGSTIEIEVDRVERYFFSRLFIRKHGSGFFKVPVQTMIVHAAGNKPKECILLVPVGWVVLEAVTEYGSRFFIFEGAKINSELRMVVWGFNARDEVLQTMEVCKTV